MEHPTKGGSFCWLPLVTIAFKFYSRIIKANPKELKQSLTRASQGKKIINIFSFSRIGPRVPLPKPKLGKPGGEGKKNPKKVKKICSFKYLLCSF
ncbi:MAG: hypothetical protein IPH66_01800 [Crocinitomicaceae bacterium]|nr:hypothetical protein [Crocinitomicaceae bacterium]